MSCLEKVVVATLSLSCLGADSRGKCYVSLGLGPFHPTSVTGLLQTAVFEHLQLISAGSVAEMCLPARRSLEGDDANPNLGPGPGTQLTLQSCPEHQSKNGLDL